MWPTTTRRTRQARRATATELTQGLSRLAGLGKGCRCCCNVDLHAVRRAIGGCWQAREVLYLGRETSLSQTDTSTNDYHPLPRSQFVPQCPSFNRRCMLESPSSCQWPAACLEVRRGRVASRSSPYRCQCLSFLIAFTRVSIVSLMAPISNRKGVQEGKKRGVRGVIGENRLNRP